MTWVKLLKEVSSDLQMTKLGGIKNVLDGRIRIPKDLDRVKHFEVKKHNEI